MAGNDGTNGFGDIAEQVFGKPGAQGGVQLGLSDTPADCCRLKCEVSAS